MRKSTQNYIVFIGLFVLGLIETVSGFILWFALPKGGGYGGRLGGGGAEFWSLSRHTWIDIHNWAAIAIVALIIIHLILHWKWVVCMTKRLFQTKSLVAKNSP